MGGEPTRVRSLEGSEVEAAGAVIARAFFEDPLACLLLPDAEERRRIAPRMFAAFVRYDHLFGHVDCLADLGGVAAWMPPDASAETPERLAAAGVEALRDEVPLDVLDTVLATPAAAIETAVPEPHWHLRLLAVEPGRQSSGLGASLLRHGLERADEIPVVLETFAERAVPFYVRSGFEAIAEGVEPTSGLRFWALRHSFR